MVVFCFFVARPGQCRVSQVTSGPTSCHAVCLASEALFFSASTDDEWWHSVCKELSRFRPKRTSEVLEWKVFWCLIGKVRHGQHQWLTTSGERQTSFLVQPINNAKNLPQHPSLQYLFWAAAAMSGMPFVVLWQEKVGWEVPGKALFCFWLFCFMFCGFA